MAHSQTERRREALIMLALVGLGLVVYLVGVTHDLPYTVQRDEYGIYAFTGAQIASTHNLRPTRLNHPASTIFYPLALAYKAWHVIARQGMLFRPDPNLLLAYHSEPAPFLLLGRLVSVCYAVLSLPLVYLLGRRVHSRTVGVVAAWFLATTPILTTLTQLIRDDSATVFFSTLAMLLILQVYRRPTARHQALAGAALGLAISTKYYLGLLGVLLGVVDLLVLFRLRRKGGRTLLVTLGNAALAGATALMAFGLTTPFFFIDLEMARTNLGSELRTTHLGADGLSSWGNLRYYLLEAMPTELTWPRVALIAAGALSCLAARPRRGEPLLLLGFAVGHIVTISFISALHWARWIIPALPPLFVLAAHALERGVRWLAERPWLARWRWPAPQRALALLLVAILALSALSVRDAVRLALLQTRYTTLVRTRFWLLENLPQGAGVAIERYSAPLERSGFRVFEIVTAASHSLDDLRNAGVEYLLTSSFMSGRYYAEPERYAREIAFYEEILPQQAELLHVIAPEGFDGGPVVRIYRLTPPDSR